MPQQLFLGPPAASHTLEIKPQKPRGSLPPPSLLASPFSVFPLITSSTWLNFSQFPNMPDLAGLWACAHADHSAITSLPFPLRNAFLRDSFPYAWRSELDISVCKTLSFVHGIPSRHRFLSRCPLSMRHTWGQMPSKRKKLMNAPASEGSSNTVPERERSTGDAPDTRTSGAAAGPW